MVTTLPPVPKKYPGRKTGLVLRLTSNERSILTGWQRSTTVAAGLQRRAKILLLVAEGLPLKDVAQTVGIGRRFVYKWVRRFQAQGLEGLDDKPGRGIHRRKAPLEVRDDA